MSETKRKVLYLVVNGLPDDQQPAADARTRKCCG